MKFEEIVNQLRKCKIQGGIWIDAGCGNGTYTIPLATLVSEVIALDKNKNNLSYLESKITSKMNIRTQHFDFSKPSWYSSFVDGILFGFSLHYDPKHRTALEHAYQQLKPGGKLVVIEYSSEKAVSWVPYPLPMEKLIKILKSLSFFSIDIIQSLPPRRKGFQWNNASYILTANK
jgi:ubiquinone/menaquinone biosynthesis C-methylase UbiE